MVLNDKLSILESCFLRPCPFTYYLSSSQSHDMFDKSITGQVVCVCTVDVLCVDAIIQSEEAHMELCRALRVSRAPNARLRLRIGKLDMSCLGIPRTVVLLEQLEQEVLLCELELNYTVIGLSSKLL